MNSSFLEDFATLTDPQIERTKEHLLIDIVAIAILAVISDAEKIAGAIRSHWGIENTLYWTLDVTFSEDQSRIRQENSPENSALLRRLALKHGFF